MLVPSAQPDSLDDLEAAIRAYGRVKGRRVTIEYCLIRDVNDSRREAQALAGFVRGIPCKINVIPCNPVDGLSSEPPDDDGVQRFLEYLYPVCPAVTLRRPRGRDVAGACGQLGASLMERALREPG